MRDAFLLSEALALEGKVLAFEFTDADGQAVALHVCRGIAGYPADPAAHCRMT